MQLPAGNRSAIWALALAALSLALYLPMLWGGFVWDSRAQILTDTFIHEPANLGPVLSLRVLGMDVLDNNRPVALLSLILDSLLWSKNPAGYHLTNLLWHAATVGLLFNVTARLLHRARGQENTFAAVCGTLLFAVHPINCEAVAEPSYREDLLVTFFVLAGLRGAQAFAGSAGRKSVLSFLCTVASLGLAVGAKESGAVGPVVILVYWLLFHRTDRRGYGLVAATAALTGGFLALRFALEPATSVVFARPAVYLGGSMADAALIQTRIWAFYLRQIVWPHELCADYGPFSIRSFNFTASLAVLLVVLPLQGLAALQQRLFALGAAVFWVALLPVSNLVPIYRPIADRFLYLPMVGVTLMLASGLALLGPRLRPAVAILIAMSALALGSITFQRERVWRDELALWTDTVAKDPRSYTAADNLGFALLHAGRPAEAATSFRRAMTLQPDADAAAGLAVALELLGRPAEADAAFAAAVRRDPRYRDPSQLVRALSWEQSDADLLRPIAARSPR